MKNTNITVIEPIEKRAGNGGGLEGAERTSQELMSWTPSVISPDRQINPVKDMADARSRDSVQNDGYALGALNTHRDGIVGGQYRLNAQPDYEAIGATEDWAEEFQRVVESRFNLVAESPNKWFDAQGQNTFTGLIRLGVGGFLLTGEVLGTFEWIKEYGRPCKTAFQMISPTRLCNPDMEMDSQTLRRGVRRDFRGKPLGYYIRNGYPFEFYPTDTSNDWKYVPVRKPWGRLQVLHIIEQMLPDQSRGIADMVSVLKEMRMTKKFQDVTLQNAVVNATYAASIESELPKELVFNAMGAGQASGEFKAALAAYMTSLQQYAGGSNNIKIDGVMMPHLFPGTKLKLQPMGTPGGVGTGYEQSLLRHIAAALGLSYEEFSRDFTNTNYSSARAAMSQSQKFMDSRKKIVADQQASAMYINWLEEDINAGNLPLPPGRTAADYYDDPIFREAISVCSWIGASRGQIDEMKETQAAILRINAGLSTREIESARLGLDFRKIFVQLGREKKLAEKYDLTFDTSATKPGANDRQQTMNGNNGEDQ